MGSHIVRDATRDISGVEACRSVARDFSQGRGEIGIAHMVANTLGRSVGTQIERASVRREREFFRIRQTPIGRLVKAEHVGDMRTDHPTGLGKADRGTEQFRPWQLSETRMRLTKDTHDARRRDGRMAEFVDSAAQHVAVAIRAFALERAVHISGQQAAGQVDEPSRMRFWPDAGSWRCRMPMPPIPHIIGSTTPWAKAQAMTASSALPPASSTL